MIEQDTQIQKTKIRQDVRQLADLLDSRFKLPFGWSIGWDGIIGLIPGIGDLIMSGFSFYILMKAAQIGCPPSVLLRMCLNIVIDNLVSLPPFFGEIFDFIWKSNTKNVLLMEQYLNQPVQTVTSAWWVLSLTFAFIISLLIAVIWFAGWLALTLWSLLVH